VELCEKGNINLRGGTKQGLDLGMVIELDSFFACYLYFPAVLVCLYVCVSAFVCEHDNLKASNVLMHDNLYRTIMNIVRGQTDYVFVKFGSVKQASKFGSHQIHSRLDSCTNCSFNLTLCLPSFTWR
jgi:hypothetical protein